MKSAKLKERELIIKLYDEGKTQECIADILGVSQSKVSYWVVRYRKFKSLDDLSRSGRPSSFSDDLLCLIKEKIEKRIVYKNKMFSSCNSKDLRKIISKEINKPISLRHCRRILHKLGFSLITPRTQHVKNDPEKIKKFREEFKKNSNRSFWVMN